MEITPWGYNGLGEIVYLRTYSRWLGDDGRSERWPETIDRVVKGIRNINAQLTESEEDRLADHMLSLRGTVSGRALWMLGTKMVDIAHQDALNNCYMSTVTKADDFRWIMDRLMVGGGVGFSVERSDVYQLPTVQKASIWHERSADADHIVSDTRTGWSTLIDHLVKAHFKGEDFSYSTLLVRGYGAPLKTFGGTASGPQALIDGVADICKVMCNRAGKKLRSVDVLDIVNIIGRVVVAGSSRRSAQISLGDQDDTLFLKAKKWSSGSIPAWRANSNNTIIVDNFSELRDNNLFWDNFNGGSEVYGLFNRKLSRNVGRAGEKNLDSSIVGGNPCVTGSTWVSTVYGPKQVKDLVGVSIPLLVDGKTYPMESDGFFATGKKETLIVTLKSGEKLQLTPNHKVMTSEGWVEAQNLEVTTSKIRVHKHTGIEWVGEGTKDEGYVLGHLVGDGSISNNSGILRVWGESAGVQPIKHYLHSVVTQLQHRSDFKGWAGPLGNGYYELQMRAIFDLAQKFGLDQRKKHISPLIESASSDFVEGFLSALFDTDGHVEGNTKKGISVRFSQSNLGDIQAVQRMLARLGIRSKIYERDNEGERLLPDGKGGHKYYQCLKNWAVVISRESTDIFMSRVGFKDTDKSSKLASFKFVRDRYRDSFLSPVKSIEYGGIESVYDVSVSEIHAFDANGFYVHNCLEIPLGNKESCNLSTIWLPNVEKFEDFLDLSSILYKVQKATALLEHPSKESNTIIHKNLRLGQSIAGILQATDEQRAWLSPAYEALREIDSGWSKKLGVRESVRLTTIQPNGTLGLVGGTTPGIHPAYDRFYIRRVRFGSNDPLVPICKDKGYPVLPEVGLDGKVDHTRLVVEFPCEAPENTPLASTTTAEEQLEWVAWAQENWADNAVSVTVTYKDNELPSIKQWLSENYDTRIKSVSFLRYSDHGFALAPYEPVTKEEYDKRLLRINKETITLKGQSELDSSDCDTGICPVR